MLESSTARPETPGSRLGVPGEGGGVCTWTGAQWRRGGRQACQEHGEGDEAGSPRTRGQQRAPGHGAPRLVCGLAWSLRGRCFASTAGTLRPGQTGQAWKERQHPASRVKVLSPTWALLILARGWELLHRRPEDLATRPVNKPETHRSESPVPDPSGHVQEVLGFHLRVPQPAGDVLTGGGPAVLKGGIAGGKQGG